MKRRIYALAAVFAASFPGLALAAQQSTVIEVSGLYCASCPYIAAQAIMAVPSANIVDGYYDPKAQIAQFVVEYDDASATLVQLISATSDYGYPAHQIDKITPTGGS